MRKISQEQPPSTEPGLKSWLNRLVTQVNASLDQATDLEVAQYPKSIYNGMIRYFKPTASPNISHEGPWISIGDVWYPLADARAIVDTAVDYTTTGGESLVVCTASISVTLNATPRESEEVIVKRITGAGSVTVVGTIDGLTNHVLSSNYAVIKLMYSASSGWVIVNN